MPNATLATLPYCVFVYGTLMPGERYYRAICAGKTTAEVPAKIRAKLYHLPEPRNYPAITQGNDWVQGWILGFTDPALIQALDDLEDYKPNRPAHANEYTKQTIQAYTREGQPLTQAQAYFMTQERVANYQGKPITGKPWQEDPPR